MALRYLVRLLLLSLGVALATYGAIDWHFQGLSLRGFWLYDNGWRPHPVHLIVIGLTLMPLALWDIFVMEALRGMHTAEAVVEGSAGEGEGNSEGRKNRFERHVGDASEES